MFSASVETFDIQPFELYTTAQTGCELPKDNIDMSYDTEPTDPDVPDSTAIHRLSMAVYLTSLCVSLGPMYY